MDVSNHLNSEGPPPAESPQSPDGRELIDQVVTATGLPENLAHQELSDILRLSGKDSEELTLEALREAMLQYLQAMDSAQAADAEPLG
jgi:hypothetical protein